MQQLTLAYAQAAIAAQTGGKITASRIKALLAPYHNTATLANITQVTQVQLAAAFKGVLIQKVTRGSVLLFANALNYAAAVQRSARKFTDNDTAKIAAFVAAEPSYTHDPDCYSIAINKNSGQEYLYAHYNRATTAYVMHDRLVDTEFVAKFCTPSVAAILLKTDRTTHNVSNDIVHDLAIRTVKVQNIVRIAALLKVLL